MTIAEQRTEPTVAFPTRIAPTLVAGLQTREEDKAAEAYVAGAKDKDVVVSEGKVVSFSKNGLIQAALQVAQLKRGYVSDDDEVVEAITRSVGDVRTLRKQGDLELYGTRDGSQRVYLWFPTVKSMALLVVRAQIDEGAAEALARALMDYGTGEEIDETALSAAFAAAPVAEATAAPAPSPETSP